MLVPLRYPARLTEQGDTTLVSFRDFPEALTEGKSIRDALAAAVDCLDTALHFRMKDGGMIPPASAEMPGEVVVTPTAAIAIRVAFYRAFKDSGLPLSEFASRAGMSSAQARDVIETHRSFDLRKVSETLRALGKPIVVAVEAA